MDAWLTVGLLQTAFVALVFARRATAAPASVWLFAWLAAAFAHQFSIYMSYAHPEVLPRTLAVGLGLLPFLHGPLAFGYVAAFLPAGALSRTAPLHLAPFFLIWGAALFIDAANPAGVSVDPTLGVTTFDGATGAVISWPSWMMALSGGLYPLVSLVLLRRARPALLASRSDYSAVNFRWLHIWVFGHIAAFAAIFAAQLMFSTRTAMPMASWVLAAEVFYLGAFGVWSVDTGARARPARAERVERESVEQDAALLKAFMEKAKPYRKPGLTLLELSEASGLSQPTITAAVKRAGYRHFFDFVNSFRCEEVKARLDRDPPPGETLLSIAYEAGFNSKSAFNRVFKHHVGVSPSEYRNRRETS